MHILLLLLLRFEILFYLPEWVPNVVIFYHRKLVTASAGSTGVVGGLERLTTTAGRNSVRIVYGETATHQAVDKVNFGSGKIFQAELVYIQFDTVIFGNKVAVAEFIFQNHLILETTATTTGNENTQT